MSSTYTLPTDLFDGLEKLETTAYAGSGGTATWATAEKRDPAKHMQLDDYILQQAERLRKAYLTDAGNDKRKIVERYAEFMNAQGEYLLKKAKTSSSQPALKTKPQSQSKKLPTAAPAPKAKGAHPLPKGVSSATPSHGVSTAVVFDGPVTNSAWLASAVVGTTTWEGAVYDGPHADADKLMFHNPADNSGLDITIRDNTELK